MDASYIQKQLELLSSADKKVFLPRFFKTAKGQYGEGDQFIGTVVPHIRKVVKENQDLDFDVLTDLLYSAYNECRLCALLILVNQFKKAKEPHRAKIVDFYLSNTHRINNWNLVDASAKDILGEHLLDKNRSVLYQLAHSSLLWEQRIAIIATFAFIRQNDFEDIFALSHLLLNHNHDLMHKAIGWMLREVGKRDKKALCHFLDQYYKQMPRTMLRYSIEKFTPEERAYYMKK